MKNATTTNTLAAIQVQSFPNARWPAFPDAARETLVAEPEFRVFIATGLGGAVHHQVGT